MKIQVVQDLICPWCYIGHHNMNQALAEWTAEHDVPVEVEWLPYQLDPLEEGAPPEDFRQRFVQRKGIPLEQMDQMFERVTQAGAALGIPFRFDRITVAVDTIPGHIAIAATPVAKQGAVVSAFHKAYFEEGRDVGKPEEIEAVAVAAGLDEAEVTAVMAAVAEPAARAEIKALVGEVQQAGISSVPYFVVNSQLGLSGGQPVEVFKQAFDQVNAVPVS